MRTTKLVAALLLVGTFTMGCPGDDSGDETGQAASSGTTMAAQTDGESTESSVDATAAGTGSEGGSTTSAGEGTTGDSTGLPGTSSGGSNAACYPDGIYGRCSENPECQCLQGATVYQVCTANCGDNSECGNAADFPGATPLCAPLNPGAAEMICVLVCTDTADCPCGLECQPSGVPGTNICVESQ